MTNDETVAQLCEEITTQWANCYFSEGQKRRDGEYSNMVVIERDKLAERILAAHKREMAEKDAENAKLRELVKELAAALEAINAKIEFDPYIGGRWNSLHMGSLVDRAKEVAK